MNDTQSQKSIGKTLALVILVAIVTGVAVTFIQILLLGNARPAVTGGVVGGVAAAMAIVTLKKRQS